MSQDNESLDVLEVLDRRATAAVDALDQAVAAAPVPDPASTDERRDRRTVPLLVVAAGLLIVALVAAGLIYTGGDEENTFAGDGRTGTDFTRLALPDPASLGYQIIFAADGPSEDSDEPGRTDPFADRQVSVLGAVGADDPWSEAVVSYSLPSEVTTLDGDPIDIGGPEAKYSEDGIGRSVGWIAGDETRYLVSTRIVRDHLVALATEAVKAGGDATGPIPDQDVLFTGVLDDVFPTTLTTVGRGAAPGDQRATVVYGPASGDGDRGLSVASVAGSEAQRRAAQVLASSSVDVSVRGRDAVLGRYSEPGPDQLLQTAWLEDDGTLVRADAIGIDEDTLIGLLNQLEPVDRATFGGMVADAPDPALPGGRPGGGEITQVPIGAVASASMTEAGVTYAASLRRGDDGQLTVEASHESEGGGGATGAAVSSLETPTVVRHRVDGRATVIGGVVGPDVIGVDIRPSRDILVDISGPSTAAIEDSTSLVFLAVIPDDIDIGFVVTATRSDGSEIRLEV